MSEYTPGPLEMADAINHIVADTHFKLNEGFDRQYLLEDLMSRLDQLTEGVGLSRPGSYADPTNRAYSTTPRPTLRDAGYLA